MAWSSDGLQWWDGVAWRPVGPDRRYYSDGQRWIPIPEAAPPGTPPAAVVPPAGAGWAWNGATWVPVAVQASRPRPPRPDPPVAAVVVIGAIVTVVAAFLPWATADAFGLNLSKSGIDGGDGWITTVTAAIAAMCAVALWFGRARVWSRVVLFVAAAVIGAVGGADWSDVNSKLSNVNNSGITVGHVGFGIYLTIAGAALVLLGTAASFRRTTAPGV